MSDDPKPLISPPYSGIVSPQNKTIGASFNGRTLVSKTSNVGSIPPAPANNKSDIPSDFLLLCVILYTSLTMKHMKKENSQWLLIVVFGFCIIGLSSLALYQSTQQKQTEHDIMLLKARVDLNSQQIKK